MKTSNSQVTRNDTSNHLVQMAHLADVTGLLASVAPDMALDTVRRRADASHAAVARAGRYRHAHWGAFCIVLAIALVGAAMLVPFSSLVLAAGGAVMLAVGLSLILLFDPKPVLQHVEAFERFCHETQDAWSASAQNHVAAALHPTIEAMERFPRDAIATGTSVKNVSELFRLAGMRARQVDAELETLEASALQNCQRAEEDLGTQMNRLRAKTRGWSSRLWARSVRRLANRVLDAREGLLTAKRQAVTLHVSRQAALVPTLQTLTTITEELQTKTASPLAVMIDAASNRIEELTQQGARGPFGKIIPNSQEILLRSREIIGARLAELSRMAAIRPEATTIEEAITQAVKTVLDNNTVTPRRLTDCVEQLNGGRENALTQLTDESTEQAVSRIIPGRVPRRVRAVIIQGGPSSPLTKAIEQRSEGCVVRGIDHDDERDLIQITESRYEPGPELVELTEASPALNLLSKDVKAAMVTAVEDDALVLDQCRPDQRSEPDRGLKLLLRGLVFDRLTRRGNTYQFHGVPASDGSTNGCLGKSFEAAATILQTDARQARRLEQAIDAEVEARGLDGTSKAIQAALNRPDFVPAVHASRAHRALTEELYQMKRVLLANGAEK
jgi:hypothetical protein